MNYYEIAIIGHSLSVLTFQNSKEIKGGEITEAERGVKEGKAFKLGYNGCQWQKHSCNGIGMLQSGLKDLNVNDDIKPWKVYELTQT